MAAFYENLSFMTAVFDSWTPCERTVVLCSLFRRIPWYNFKLLKKTIDLTLEQIASPETEKLENEANNVAIITETTKTTGENDQAVDIGQKLSKLLVYLPLLNPGNYEVKEAFLNSVPDIIQLCVDNNYYMHECKQYLSYMLIHPALDSNDRRSLSHWLKYLENHLATAHNVRQGSTSPSNYGSASSLSNGYTDTGSRGSDGNVSTGPRNSIGDISTGPRNSIGDISNGNQICLTDLINNTNICINGIAQSLAGLPTSSANGAFRRTIGKNLEPKNDVGYSNDCLNDSFTKNGKEIDLSSEGDIAEPTAKSTRSNSLTPPSSNISSSAENLNDEYFVQKPRSFSLSSEHMAQMKPLLATTGSETRLDVLRANSFGEHPGMSTVDQWLKSLRLHKYVWLFHNISYEQMMAMDEEYLQKFAVTTGARHKLLLCINNLHARSSLLEGMARQLSEEAPSGPAIALMLEQLREVLISPILPGSRLTQQLVQVLELASTRLLSGSQSHPPLPAFPAYDHTEDHFDHPVAGYDPVSMHCWLLDRALHHPSFACSPELVDSLKRLRYRLPPKQFFNHLSDVPFSKKNIKTRWRSQGPPNKLHMNKRPSGSWLTIPSKFNNQYKSCPYVPHARKSIDSTKLHHSSTSLNDINSRLESLCLQMTEKAMTE